MQPAANVIDFVHYRQRRLAQNNAALMWAMYSAAHNLALMALHAGVEQQRKARP